MKKKITITAAAVFLLALIVVLFSGQASQTAMQKIEKKITLTGTVRLVGSAPFYEVVITDNAGKDWFIDQSEQKPFEKFQHQEITVKCSVEYVDMVLADGRFLGQRAVIKNVKVTGKKR